MIQLCLFYSNLDDEFEGQSKHLKYVQLTPEYGLHIIKYETSAYVCSGEISALLWSKDQRMHITERG